MRTYTLKKIHGTPDWDTIPVMPIDNLLWTDSVDITAQAQLCWDEDALYLRMEATEPNIRMKGSHPLAKICKDSCLEFFLQPTEGSAYLNFEMNPLCNAWIGYGIAYKTRVRIMYPDFKEQFAPQVTFTSTGWVLTYRIPFAFVRMFFPTFRAKEGLQVRGNCYKCGDETVKPHYLAWSPVVNEEPAFHKPEYFGCLIFGE